MSRRGHNLRSGTPDGDRGRRLGGRAHAAWNREVIDDSGRTYGQYWAMVGWLKMVEEHGREKAGRIMARRGSEWWRGERQRYSRYLGEMRLAAERAAGEETEP